MSANAAGKILAGLVDAHAIVALEARAIDAETRMARARALLADLMDEIGDAPFGVLAALVEIANELEAENG